MNTLRLVNLGVFLVFLVVKRTPYDEQNIVSNVLCLRSFV